MQVGEGEGWELGRGQRSEGEGGGSREGRHGADHFFFCPVRGCDSEPPPSSLAEFMCALERPRYNDLKTEKKKEIKKGWRNTNV